MERIGKYEILSKIGEGGFGVVYRGRDPYIKRTVALKTCASESEEIRKRFFREAEIAGNLHHPNIVTIHDFGIEDDTPYLVQEFLSGEDLKHKILSGEDLPLATSLSYLKQVAEALEYAHSQGVIHRDIKPANIRILDSGRAKVMDFGIARLKDQQTRLTQTGTTLGTVAYLSPEQLRGGEIDHRADLYSFGVVAFELLSGERPFDAKTLPQLFYKLLNEVPPPLDELDSECPRELATLVARCLEKQPDDRFDGFTLLLEDLGPILERQLEETRNVADTGVSLRIEGEADRPEAEGTAAAAAAKAAAPPLPRLAEEARRAVDGGDVTAAELTLSLARRVHGTDAVELELAELVAEIETLKAQRDDKLRAQVAAALLQEQENAELAARQRGHLVRDLQRQVERLFDVGKIEQAGIHLARLRGSLADHPVFRHLEGRFKSARRAKIEGKRRSGTKPAAARAVATEPPGLQGPSELAESAELLGPLGPPGSPESSGPPAAALATAAPPISPDSGPAEPELSPDERLEAVLETVSKVEACLKAGRLSEATGRLARGRRELGETDRFDALAERLAAVERLTTVKRLVEEAQKAISGDQFRYAQDLLLDALRIDPQHTEAKAAFKKAEMGLRRRSSHDRR